MSSHGKWQAFANIQFETSKKMTRKTKNTRKDEGSWKEPNY